jgi:thiol-disulfide isomerase/thioredoxin
MTREVYTDKEFIRFTRKYVFIRLFQDTDPQGARLASRYRVEGFPTLIILNSSGREVDRILGFRSAPDLIDEIQDITKDDGRITL